MQFYEGWSCGRAATIKAALPDKSPILIANGGGTTIQNSLDDWAFSCDAFDIISVHDYGTSVYNSVTALQSATARGKALGKSVIFGEWGAAGDNKASIITSFVQQLEQAQIPHMIWEVTKPGKGGSDFEIWTDEPAWDAFSPPSSPSQRHRKRSEADDTQIGRRSHRQRRSSSSFRRFTDHNRLTVQRQGSLQA